MKIDLSKKPEGATHINPHSGLWVKCFGGNSGSYQFFKDGEWEMGFGCMSNSYLEIAQPEHWTGEGLPPVGTVCEVEVATNTESMDKRPEGWHRTTILAHYAPYGDELQVAICPVDRKVYQRIAECFRPIRTPEQIAADERESGVEGIRKAVSTSPNCKAHGLEWDVACAIYDAGYRLQVQS